MLSPQHVRFVHGFIDTGQCLSPRACMRVVVVAHSCCERDFFLFIGRAGETGERAHVYSFCMLYALKFRSIRKKALTEKVAPPPHQIHTFALRLLHRRQTIKTYAMSKAYATDLRSVKIHQPQILYVLRNESESKSEKTIYTLTEWLLLLLLVCIQYILTKLIEIFHFACLCACKVYTNAKQKKKNRLWCREKSIIKHTHTLNTSYVSEFFSSFLFFLFWLFFCSSSLRSSFLYLLSVTRTILIILMSITTMPVYTCTHRHTYTPLGTFFVKLTIFTFQWIREAEMHLD